MRKRHNSAGRLLRVFEKVVGHKSEKEMWAVWQEVFGLNHSDPRLARFEVPNKVRLLYHELLDAREKMSKLDYSPELYEPGFKGAEQLLYPESLPGQLQNYRAHLSDTCLQSLRFTAEMLPDEEDEVREEDLEILQIQLDELSKEVMTGNLPDFVKDFVCRQIGYINRAIKDYEFVGAKAFRDALNKAIIDFGENREIVKEYGDSEEMSTLKNLWTQTCHYGGKTIKIAGGINTLYQLYEYGKHLLP